MAVPHGHCRRRCGETGTAAITRPRRLTAGDKDSEPRWSPDGKWIAFTAKRKDDAEPQVYRIAPDGGEAERRDEDRHGGGRAQVVSRQQAHRLRVQRLAGLEVRRGAGETAEGTQGLESEGARDRARGHALLGSLADRRTRTPRVCLRRAHRTQRGSAGGPRGRAAAVGAVGGGLRHLSGRSAARDHRRPGARARPHEPARHRDHRPGHAPQAGGDRGDRHRRRVAGLFAGRQVAVVQFLRHQARIQRPGASHAVRAPRRGAARAGAEIRPRRDARAMESRFRRAPVRGRGPRARRTVPLAACRGHSRTCLRRAATSRVSPARATAESWLSRAPRRATRRRCSRRAATGRRRAASSR